MFALFLVLLTWEQQYASMMLAFFMASVFPDIDSKNSTVRKNASITIPAILSLFVVFNPDLDLQTRIFAGMVALFASHIAIESLPLSHRGKRSLHTTPLMLIFSVLIGIAVWMTFRTPNLWQLIVAALLGYATHMTADKLFNRG
ncbi:MAG: metal-dependent hydrolase [Candidatus Aenigmarchaeota archaeon]|nr:metal-dependent hydrolase [Candidatus Aenigmarchaeota archaeon]